MRARAAGFPDAAAPPYVCWRAHHEALLLALSAFVGVALSACAPSNACPSAPPAVPAVIDYAADFDDLLTEIGKDDAYLEARQIDWNAVRRRLAPRARAIHDKASFIPLLEAAIDALHDAHANLGTNTPHSHIDGTPREAWLPPVRVDLVGNDAEGKAPILDRALEVLGAPSHEPVRSSWRRSSPT